MAIISGTIESVKDDGGKKNSFGKFQHKIAVKISGDWYGGWTPKSAEAQGLVEGANVSFEWVQNGEYKNFPKGVSFKIASEGASGAPAVKPAATTGYVASTIPTSTRINGATVGMSINNSCILLANKLEAMKPGESIGEAVERVARSILAVSLAIESGAPVAAKPAAIKAVAAKPKADVQPVEEFEDDVIDF